MSLWSPLLRVAQLVTVARQVCRSSSTLCRWQITVSLAWSFVPIAPVKLVSRVLIRPLQVCTRVGLCTVVL